MEEMVVGRVTPAGTFPSDFVASNAGVLLRRQAE